MYPFVISSAIQNHINAKKKIYSHVLFMDKQANLFSALAPNYFLPGLSLQYNKLV